MTLMLSRRSLLQAAALAGGLMLAPGALAAPHHGFTHAVASGDPQSDSVVLWTRFVAADGGETPLGYEVAADAQFRKLVARGATIAGPLRDHCAQVRQTGLKPGRWYFYRFRAPDGSVSPVGRTRTLPAGSLDRFRIAVFSCANATSGWFTAYAHAAARDDLDLLVHTGDYIYESPTDRSDALAALAAARDIQPLGEAVSLADYRLRYASYRRDPGLQELHRRYPMIVMWDDHEVANNSWAGGAKNHDPGEGEWAVRKAAGVRAFREWLPTDGSDYQAYPIGRLATLFRLETRLLARSRQLDVGAALAGPGALAAKAVAFRDGPLADPARTMMGAAQEQWLDRQLAASVAGGARWQILAQQVIMAPARLPVVTADWYARGAAPTAEQQAELKAAAALAALGVPSDMDRWSGYPAARARLFDSAARAAANLVVLSGDSHNAWAFDLRAGDRPVGVEFAGHSVSSLGLDKRFGGDPASIAAAFTAANPELRWCDTSRRGYMVTTLSPRTVENEWLFLPSRDSQSTEVIGRHQEAVELGARRLSRA